MIPAIREFRRKNYDASRKILEVLRQEFPESATVRVWLADATLFDSTIDYEEAARTALPIYAEARKLVDAGCKLGRRPTYYLLMGQAYAALRVDDYELARSALQPVVKRWSRSAEAHYNLARAECGANRVDPCFEHFEQALTVAESLDRPRFLRTHRSTEDWIVRSEKQSEFGPLREDPRYYPAIVEARRRTATSDAPLPRRTDEVEE